MAVGSKGCFFFFSQLHHLAFSRGVRSQTTHFTLFHSTVCLSSETTIYWKVKNKQKKKEIGIVYIWYRIFFCVCVCVGTHCFFFFCRRTWLIYATLFVWLISHKYIRAYMRTWQSAPLGTCGKVPLPGKKKKRVYIYCPELTDNTLPHTRENDKEKRVYKNLHKEHIGKKKGVAVFSPACRLRSFYSPD